APGERRPELARELAPAPALAAALMGLAPFDARLAAVAQPAADRPAAHVPPTAAVEARLEELALPLQTPQPIVVLLAEAAQAPDWRGLAHDLPAATLRLDAPEVGERRLLWTQALSSHRLAGESAAISEVAQYFRLGPAQIAGAARSLWLDGGGADQARQRL